MHSDSVSFHCGLGERTLRGEETFDLERFSGSSEAAAEHFEKALELNPLHVPSLIGLGKCLAFSPGLYKDAARLFQAAIDLNPQSADGYYELGLLGLREAERIPSDQRDGLLDESIRNLRKARDFGFKHVSWLANALGTAHFRKGTYRDAIQCFQLSYEALLKEGTWIPSTFFLAGRASVYLSDVTGAVEWYTRGLEEGRVGGLDASLPVRIRSLRRISRYPWWLQRPLLAIHRFAWHI